MLFFTRWKAAGILLTALIVCLFARAKFLLREHGAGVAVLGAAPHRARPRSAGRLEPAARSRRQRRAQGTPARRSPTKCCAFCARRAFPSPDAPSTATASRCASPATPTWTTRSASCASCRSRCREYSAPRASAPSTSPRTAGRSRSPPPMPQSPSASARRSTSRSRSSSAASTSSGWWSRPSSAKASTASWCRSPACKTLRG